MSERAQILRVVVASPADVNTERAIVPRVVDDLNAGVAADRGLRLEVIRWETDSYPGFHPEGPQGLIDTTLHIEDSDIVIGIFWKRFGTPTKEGTTGTEHEIRRSYEAWLKHGRPQVMVYFNQKPSAPQSQEEAVQWGKVLRFRKDFPKEGLWWPYTGTAEFERLLRAHLTSYVRNKFQIGVPGPESLNRKPETTISGVRPEADSPDQREGDVASVCPLPNASHLAQKEADEAHRSADAERVQPETAVEEGAEAKRKVPKKGEEAQEVRNYWSRRKQIAAGLILIAFLFPALAILFPALLGSLKTKLGLGPHFQLVLQVQVQDAFKDQADQVIGSLKFDLEKADIPVVSVDRNDPSTVEQADTIRIDLKGIPRSREGDLQGLVRARYPGWSLMRIAETDYTLTPAVAEIAVIKRDTVERTLATIQDRLRGLTAAGRAFRRPGSGSTDHEIIVQLWGEPAELVRAKQFLTAGGRLEVTLVMDGPFPSQDAARAQHGGILPLNTKLAKVKPRGDVEGEQWYLLGKTPVIQGSEMRNARSGQDEFRKWETSFTLSLDAGKRFGRYTESNIGNRLAVVLDGQIVSVATIQSKIEDSGRITGLGSEQEASDLAMVLRSGSLPVGVAVVEEH